MTKRTIIDEELCRKVELLIKGGASIDEAAKLTNTSEGTINRIKAAGFDIEKFNENKEKRRMKERKQKEEEEQIPGQIQIDFPEDPDDAFNRYVKEVLETMNKNAKMFQAGMEQIAEEKKELAKQREDVYASQRRLYNMIGFIKDALESIREELIV